jgi:hypothetical protein
MASQHFRALYHPHYVPDIELLKTQLLLWDQLYRIVPESMISNYGDGYIKSKFNINPSLCPFVSPTYEDLSYFDKYQYSIEKAFDQIAAVPESRFMAYQDCIGIHPEKAPEWVFDYLINKKLARKEKEKREGWFEEHYVVHPEAGRLVLSCLGASIAKRQDYQLITDRNNSFYLTAANEINGYIDSRSKMSILGTLAAMILKTIIPQGISTIPFELIIKLRNDYSDLKIAFHKVVKRIINELDNDIDIKTAEEKIRSSCDDYLRAYREFSSIRSKTLRFIKNWKTQSFGISLGILGNITSSGSKTSLLLGIGSVSVSIVGIVFPGRLNEQQKSFRFLQSMQHLFKPTDQILGLKPFLVGIKY